MNRLTALGFVISTFAVVSHAGEVTVETRPFTIETCFDATVLPSAGCVLLLTEPKLWTDFEIEAITAHGSKVAKDDVLVSFDPTAIDKKITDTRTAVATGALKLAQAEHDLKTLQETTPHKLAAVRHAAEIAKEENTYFTQTRRKAETESAAHQLDRAKQILSNQQEELKQLTQMYQADDLTEDTEEIILTRQKDAVASAEFALRMETLAHTRTLEVKLPRETITLADHERNTAATLAKSELEFPRSIELKKIEVESLKISTQREKDNLAELEQDRKLFEIKAPAEGIFYHAPIENGRWSPNPELIENLVIHGNPPINRPFATFVPSAVKLVFVGFPDETSARSLKPELTGTAIFAGREDMEIPVSLTKLAAVPAPDGNYRAELSATWPKDWPAVIGTTASIRIIAYQKQDAIAIPTKALTHTADAWTVEVKLADGKTEPRPVKRGRISGDLTEILSGLEIGQVVIAR